MNLTELQDHWERFGKTDPFWSILTNSGTENGQWDKEEFFQTGRRSIKRAIRYMEALNVHPTRGHALDFGCGVGRLSQALADHFDHVTGVDISPSMIQQANEYNTHGTSCSYVLNATNDLSQFADQSFDFVFSSITLQHIRPDYARNYIREFVRILRPDGILLFQLPSHENIRKLKSLPAILHTGIKYILPYTWYDMLLQGPLDAWNKGKPRMEMHGIRRPAVKALLERSGVTVLDISANTQTGPVWHSYWYCASKSPSLKE